MSTIKLIPSPHTAIWGGEKLARMGKKPRAEGENIAESWELSFVPGSEATDGQGIPLSEKYTKADFGLASADLPFFPVLTKFIDAKSKLSVQVHPSDEVALADEGQYGKTEMWYIVSAEPGAGIYAGLRRKVGKEEFAAAVADGTVESLLAFHEVHPGDVFFIPSGTIHAIGGGVLLYEIQQNSTLTYRLYDYGRRDAAGNLRPLHVEKALKVALLDEYKPQKNDPDHPEIIGKCKYFLAKRLVISEKTVLTADEESYLSVTVIRGSGSVAGLPASPLDSFFTPAGDGAVEILPDGEMEIVTVETRR